MKLHNINPFIRLSCGCVGLLIGRTEQYLCIRRCDRDHFDNEVDPWLRALDLEKVHKGRPLTNHEVDNLISHMSTLIHLGYAFLEVKRSLTSKWPELETLTFPEHEENEPKTTPAA